MWFAFICGMKMFRKLVLSDALKVMTIIIQREVYEVSFQDNHYSQMLDKYWGYYLNIAAFAIWQQAHCLFAKLL